MRRKLFLLTSVCLALLGAGCSASVTKHELYAAYGDDGVPTYYRIKLHASGFNGAVEYRAGWFEAAAVDDLFGDIASDTEMRTQMAKQQREAVARTMKAYLDVLVEHPDAEAEIVLRKKALDAALASLSGVTPAGASPMTLLDYAQKKFIIVVSLRPDEVIAAVKGQVQKRKLIDSIKGALSARNDAETDVLRMRLEALDKSVEEATQEIDGAPTREVLLKVLGRVKAEAEVIQ